MDRAVGNIQVHFFWNDIFFILLSNTSINADQISRSNDKLVPNVDLFPEVKTNQQKINFYLELKIALLKYISFLPSNSILDIYHQGISLK